MAKKKEATKKAGKRRHGSRRGRTQGGVKDVKVSEQPLTDEQAKQEFEQSRCQEPFPRIVTSAKIQSYTRDLDGITLKFKDFKLPTSKEDVVKDMLTSEDDLVITIAVSTGKLFSAQKTEQKS